MPAFNIVVLAINLALYMTRLFLCFFTTCIINNVRAQTNQIAGEYYMQGVMETASGFKLDEDSTFKFFFSYGALDRFGSGRWSVRDDKIILNSKSYPGADFKLVKATKEKDDFIIVKIEDANPDTYNWVHCLVETKDGDTLIDANRDGVIKLPSTTDSIHLVSEFSSERISTFAMDKTKYNFFAFHFEPWIMEVFFKDFTLQLVGDHLEGKHPLLPDKIYKYVR
jgi:hypothetical protein